MKANRYLLTVIAIASVINLQAEKTLFGASGSHPSRTMSGTYSQTPMPAAKMRSTSTLMYQPGQGAQSAVYVAPSQTVKFKVPNIFSLSRRTNTSRNYMLHSYGGGGTAGAAGQVKARTNRTNNPQAVNIGVPDIPQLTKSYKLSRETVAPQGGAGGERQMASTSRTLIRSGSILSEAAAESYYTLYDAQVQEEAERSVRRGRPGDLPDPYDEPVGDIPAVLMAMLVAGYIVSKRKKYNNSINNC